METAYAEHAAYLRGYLLSRGLARTVEDADDLVAATYERAVMAAPRYRDDGKPRAWLQQIARNLAIDALRQQRSHETRAIPASFGQTWTDPAERLDLLAACARLGPKQRQCIGLRYGAGYTRRETAERLGTTDNSVAKLQMRALKRLRELLGAAI